MSERLVKKKYLHKIQKMLASVDLYFEVADMNLDDYTEESLFLECWEIQQMSQTTPMACQLYKLWASRCQDAKRDHDLEEGSLY